MNHPNPGPAALIAELNARLPNRVATGEAIRAHHGRDESHFAPALPDAVVFPASTEEVVEIVHLCRKHHTPMIPFGIGSSLEGHVLPTAGGITLDLSQMNRVLALHAEDFDVVVQPGVTRKQLNAEIRDSGLFFSVDPGADATLGGMAATRASGTNAVRYGTMRDNVLATTTVLADGSVIRTGSRARKSSAGYDLTRLLVGSEGTLGIMTELTLRLHPQPEATSAAVCNFRALADAVRCVIQTIQHGVPVARVELIDAVSIRAINAYSKTRLAEAPTLFFEFHGSAGSVDEQATTVQQIAREHGGAEFEWASRTEDRSRLWQARHDTYFASLQLKPGCRALTTDVCVPISRLADCIEATREDILSHDLVAPIVGHVGDGNFHVIVLIDPNSPAENERAEAFHERLVRRALAMDGTCTGEHGVGIGKRHFLVAEHGEAAVEAMRAIKRALDPENLLNPGKILPPRD
jgi:D-lactate dehydrogenase (cytochrome)